MALSPDSISSDTEETAGTQSLASTHSSENNGREEYDYDGDDENEEKEEKQRILIPTFAAIFPRLELPIIENDTESTRKITSETQFEFVNPISMWHAITRAAAQYYLNVIRKKLVQYGLPDPGCPPCLLTPMREFATDKADEAWFSGILRRELLDIYLLGCLNVASDVELNRPREIDRLTSDCLCTIEYYLVSSGDLEIFSWYGGSAEVITVTRFKCLLICLLELMDGNEMSAIKAQYEACSYPPIDNFPLRGQIVLNMYLERCRDACPSLPSSPVGTSEQVNKESSSPFSPTTTGGTSPRSQKFLIRTRDRKSREPTKSPVSTSIPTIPTLRGGADNNRNRWSRKSDLQANHLEEVNPA